MNHAAHIHDKAYIESTFFHSLRIKGLLKIQFNMDQKLRDELIGPILQGEQWEFIPGQLVLVHEAPLTLGGDGLLAVASIPEDFTRSPSSEP